MDVPVHLIWWQGLDEGIRTRYRANLDSWAEHFPRGRVHIWDQQQVLALIDRAGDSTTLAVRPLLDGSNPQVRLIEMCDIARLVLLYIQGGIYADMDVKILGDLSPLLEGDYEFAAPMDGLLANNCFLIARVGSPFIRETLLPEIQRRMSERGPVNPRLPKPVALIVKAVNVDWTTGPWVVDAMMRKRNESRAPVLASAGTALRPSPVRFFQRFETDPLFVHMSDATWMDVPETLSRASLVVIKSAEWCEENQAIVWIVLVLLALLIMRIP